jgi:hypothetical protein
MTGPGCAHPTRGPRRRWATVITVAGVLALVGCGEAPVQWPDDPVPAASTLDAAEAEAATEVQSTLAAYRDAATGVYADPPPLDEAKRQLQTYLADPLLTVTLLELDLMRSRGLTRTGAPASESTVTEIQLDQTPPTATMRECLDSTGWPVTDQAGTELTEISGLPAWATPQRHVLIVTARLLDGRWLLADAHVERGEQC